MIVENDIRLMRRYLICAQWREALAGAKIYNYLKNQRKINFRVLGEYTPKEGERYLNRLLEKEKWLARKFGYIVLPEFGEAIFLNSKWANPYTLYVHLVEPVPELGALGQIYWLPPDQKGWHEIAEANDKAYQAYVESLKPKKRSVLKRLFGG